MFSSKIFPPKTYAIQSYTKSFSYILINTCLLLRDSNALHPKQKSTSFVKDIKACRKYFIFLLLIYYCKPCCVKNKTWKRLEKRNKINNFSLFCYTHCFCTFLPRDIHPQIHTAVSYFSCASLHCYKSTLNPKLEIKGQKEHLTWSTAQAREKLTRHLQWGKIPLY